MTQPIDKTKPKRPQLMAETGEYGGCLSYLLLMFTFLVTCTVLTCIGLYLTSIYLHEEGIQLDAQVIRKEISEVCSEGSCSDAYFIEYLFVTQNEQQIIGKERVDRTHYEATPIGGGWPVVYLRSEPTTYESRYRATTLLTNTRYMVYGCLFVSLGFFIYWVVDRLRKYHFQRKSKLIQGVITQRWRESSDDGACYYIAYNFPGGEETKAALSFNQYQQQKVGSSLTIRYLPSNPRRSLLVE